MLAPMGFIMLLSLGLGMLMWWWHNLERFIHPEKAATGVNNTFRLGCASHQNANC